MQGPETMPFEGHVKKNFFFFKPKSHEKLWMGFKLKVKHGIRFVLCNNVFYLGENNIKNKPQSIDLKSSFY